MDILAHADLEARDQIPELGARVGERDAGGGAFLDHGGVLLRHLLAREREGVTLVPPIVVRDELESGVLVEHCRIPQLTESFYAIIQNRRFPNALLADLLTRYVGTEPNPVAS